MGDEGRISIVLWHSARILYPPETLFDLAQEYQTAVPGDVATIYKEASNKEASTFRRSMLGRRSLALVHFVIGGGSLVWILAS